MGKELYLIHKDMKWELVNFCEFDKFAVKSYCAIHNVNERLNLGDINFVNENNLPYFNMICGGSPCTDFSIAGNRKGSIWTCKNCGHKYNPLTVHYSKRDKCPNCQGIEKEKTRSSLLVEFLRIIRANKPNFGIYENVKNIVGKKFKETTFKLFEEELQEYGYNTYWKVLNSADYGLPQNRERLYLIFIKKELDNGKFLFPEPIQLETTFQDILEINPDKKYDMSDRAINCLEKYKPKTISNYDITPTLTCELSHLHGKNLYPKLCCMFENLGMRPRHLTIKECFRLMGFTDEDAQKCIDAKVSKTQIYKQIGNSITVNTLYYIYKELYIAMPYLFENLKLSSFFSGIGAFEIALDKLYNDMKLHSHLEI